MTVLGVRRQLAVSLVPVALAALALGVVVALRESAAAGFPASGPAAAGLALTFVLGAALGSLHRPLGGPALGLGAAALPGAILVLGAAGAAGVAATGYLLGGIGRRLLRDLSPSAPDPRRGLVRLAEGAGRSALAALAAAGAWTLAAGTAATEPAAASLGAAAGRSSTAAAFSWTAAAWAGGAYLAVFAALVLAAEALRRPRRAGRGLTVLVLTLPLAVDAAAWALGALVARVGDALGWGVAAALLWAVALLALEAGRLAFLQGAFERRAVDLARVSRASHRMAVSGFGLSGVAAQLRAECARLLEVHWFHLSLYPEGAEEAETVRSWWAGPDGTLHGGTPDPGPSPPPLPGIHRRRPWKVVDRELAVGDRRLGHLRLWCDPRKARPAKVELLDSLLPQLSAWVHRALLDREAREDPLTGVPTRRHLERALAEAFARAWEGGGRLAVVLADLDHFKRINDSHGHAAGDRALVAVAETLETHRRTSDTCARYGGEEFALLVDGADGAAALQVAERLRRAVECLAVEAEGKAVPLTVSAGVAAFPELWASAPGELLALADEALYEAKRRGRNRVLLNLGRGRYKGAGEGAGGEGDGEQGEGEGGEERPVVAPRIFA
jgi:diguanylate cyclase (GGDEF)-like protein